MWEPGGVTVLVPDVTREAVLARRAQVRDPVDAAREPAVEGAAHDHLGIHPVDVEAELLAREPDREQTRALHVGPLDLGLRFDAERGRRCGRLHVSGHAARSRLYGKRHTDGAPAPHVGAARSEQDREGNRDSRNRRLGLQTAERLVLLDQRLGRVLGELVGRHLACRCLERRGRGPPLSGDRLRRLLLRSHGKRPSGGLLPPGRGVPGIVARDAESWHTAATREGVRGRSMEGGRKDSDEGR